MDRDVYFIVEQGGSIKVAQPGAATATEFLNISSKIIAAASADC
jgi:hypothetical protein